MSIGNLAGFHFFGRVPGAADDVVALLVTEFACRHMIRLCHSDCRVMHFCHLIFPTFASRRGSCGE